MILQDDVLAAIKQVSDEFGIPMELVKRIYSCQFEYVVSEMRKGDIEKGHESFKQVQLPGLGTFYVEPTTVTGMLKRRERKKNESSGEVQRES